MSNNSKRFVIQRFLEWKKEKGNEAKSSKTFSKEFYNEYDKLFNDITSMGYYINKHINERFLRGSGSNRVYTPQYCFGETGF